MKVCIHCGTQYPDDARNCPSCASTAAETQCNNCRYVFSQGIYCPQCGVKAGTQAKLCPECGTTYYSRACPSCGYTSARATAPAYQPRPAVTERTVVVEKPVYVDRPIVVDQVYRGTPRDKWIALLLCFFLGLVGAHKFYERKFGVGLVYLFTGGIFGLGVFIDFFILLFKSNPYYV